MALSWLAFGLWKSWRPGGPGRHLQPHPVPLFVRGQAACHGEPALQNPIGHRRSFFLQPDPFAHYEKPRLDALGPGLLPESPTHSLPHLIVTQNEGWASPEKEEKSSKLFSKALPSSPSSHPWKTPVCSRKTHRRVWEGWEWEMQAWSLSAAALFMGAAKRGLVAPEKEAAQREGGRCAVRGRE